MSTIRATLGADKAVIRGSKIAVTVSEALIPEEAHTLIEFRQRGLPGFATVNAALKEFEHKIAFPWHLSVLIRCIQLAKDRLPSADEQNLLYKFEHKLASPITVKANALFVARVTHDAYREIIWRVHDPEPANSVLRGILLTKDYPREFEFRMDEDPRWEKATWYLDRVTIQ